MWWSGVVETVKFREGVPKKEESKRDFMKRVFYRVLEEEEVITPAKVA